MHRALDLVLALALGGGLLLSPACGDKDDTGPAGDGGATDGGATDGGGEDGGASGDLGEVSVSFDEVIPTVATLSWTTDEPGVSWVTFGLEAGDEHSTPETASTSTTHAVTVLGLVASMPNLVQAHTRLADGTVLSGPVQTLDLDLPPAALPSVTISSVDAARWNGDGYVLTSWMQAGDSYVVILDRQGRHVWWRQAGADLTITTAAPGRDGSSIVYAQYDRAQKVDVGGVVRQPLAGGDYASVTRTLTGHHAFAELPGERIAWLGFDETGSECNPSLGLDAYLMDVIYEKDEGSLEDDDYEVIWAYSDYGAPPRLCSHMSVEGYDTGSCDWTHGNSLMYDEYEDVLYVMHKNIDNIIKIDRATGVVMWEMGGPNSDFTIDGAASDWWSHAHMSWMGDGEFTLFDNRYHEGGVVGVSRASHYSYDESTMQVKLEWTYADPDDAFIQLLGDVRPLENGNYLVSWTSSGLLNEITPDGDVVWQLETDLGTAIGRVHYLPDLYDLSTAQ